VRGPEEAREPLPVFVGPDRVVPFLIAQHPQDDGPATRLPGPVGVEHFEHRFPRRRAEPVHQAESPGHEAVEVSRHDERKLEEREGAAREQHLAKRPPLPRGLGPEHFERVAVHEFAAAEQLAQVPIARGKVLVPRVVGGAGAG
jgi:hypothetical protein